MDGEPRPLDRPFFLMATQNPVESQGIFPLPEAQLDRFLTGIPSRSPKGARGKGKRSSCERSWKIPLGSRSRGSG